MAFQPTAITHERDARSRGEAFAVATVVRAERPTSCAPATRLSSGLMGVSKAGLAEVVPSPP